MIHYPITITDNFFDDPEYVLSIAEKGTYTNPDAGRWPGVRSQPLHEIDGEFFNYLLQRYFLMFFPKEDFYGDFKAHAVANFQRIPPGVENGWVHMDYPKTHTFLIYLTPDADP